jgi:hypothetical protein
MKQLFNHLRLKRTVQ